MMVLMKVPVVANRTPANRPKKAMVAQAGTSALKLAAIIGGTESGSLILIFSTFMRALKITVEKMPAKNARKRAEAPRLPATFSGSRSSMKQIIAITAQMMGFCPLELPSE